MQAHGVQNPIRVAAYCRVSSNSEDQLHSYAAQIKYYTEYIGQHPDWVLVDIFADEGLTGQKTDKRDDLLRLVSECKKGKIDRIICKSVSRFARNTQDCLSLTRLLKSYGVSVFFEEQNLDTADMPDEFMLTVHGMQAQEESINHSKNMRWSYQKKMEKGDFNCCRAAYGYDWISGSLEINEAEAAVVSRIF
ncbi:MAG: recombinase family protein, partial [Prevotellaceae bacterium]|nr:recombinase family protein [Prevotellaceae bacterium]